MAQDILGVIAQIGRGSALEEINKEFTSVMEDVNRNGGKGEVTIKVHIGAKAWSQQTGELTEVDITHSLSSKRPKRKVGASTFFVTRTGELTRNNPEQIEMFDGAPAGERRAV